MKIRFTDILLAAGSGILSALSFPKFGLSFLAWISLIPLLLLIFKKNPKQSFILGLVAGFAFYAVLIYWIPSVPSHYGNLSFGLSLFIYILLVFFLGLFWAFFALFSSKTARAFPRTAYLAVPFIWVAFEYVLTHFLTGFPWGLLGHSQFINLYFIQMASVTGVYGLSCVLVLFQSLFLFSMNFRKRMPFFAGLSVVLLIHFAGFLRVKDVPGSENSFKASVIQGNVSSDIYWDRISDEETRTLFNQHIDLTQKAIAGGSRLVIWPEFSVPLCFSCPYGIYQEFKDTLFQLVEATGATLLLGTNETSQSGGHIQYHNTALCLSPKHTITQYFKMHLVPFGEYTPYKTVFAFIEKMTHAIGDITPGKEHILHSYEGIRFGSPICYEIIFPNLVRRFVKKGASFLVTITNDGWYGQSSAPYQHFAIAVFRAVENRRFLLRAATTGISGIINPYGRILSRTELETQSYLTGRITPLQTQTPYTRFGDVLPLASLTLTALFFILSLLKRKDEQ